METLFTPLVTFFKDIPKVSDRIAFALFIFILFWIIDQNFKFSTQYLSDKEFSKFKEILQVYQASGISENQNGDAKDITERLLGKVGASESDKQKWKTALASNHVIDIDLKVRVLKYIDEKLLRSEPTRIGHMDEGFDAFRMPWQPTGLDSSNFMSNMMVGLTYRHQAHVLLLSMYPDLYPAIEFGLFRNKYSLLYLFTSGSWLFLYWIATTLFLFTIKTSGSVIRDFIGRFFIFLFLSLLIFFPSILALWYLSCNMPVFFHPTINYALNIAICTYYVEALCKVLNGFFETSIDVPAVAQDVKSEVAKPTAESGVIEGATKSNSIIPDNRSVILGIWFWIVDVIRRKFT